MTYDIVYCMRDIDASHRAATGVYSVQCAGVGGAKISVSAGRIAFWLKPTYICADS